MMLGSRKTISVHIILLVIPANCTSSKSAVFDFLIDICFVPVDIHIQVGQRCSLGGRGTTFFDQNR